MPVPNLIKIFQTIKSLNAPEFGLEIYLVECKRKRTKLESSFLHVTLLLDLAPASVAQLNPRLTGDQEVADSTPAG